MVLGSRVPSTFEEYHSPKPQTPSEVSSSWISDPLVLWFWLGIIITLSAAVKALHFESGGGGLLRNVGSLCKET